MALVEFLLGYFIKFAYNNTTFTTKMRLIIASDSFKGSLPSLGVADAVEQGFHSHIPDCEVIKVAIADGGEGTIEAMVATLNGCEIEIDVCDPIHRPIRARYGVVDGGNTAIIELAAASGITLLNISERNPLITSTFGTGEMIADAIKRGCRNFLVCIGGSATNDAGTGLLRALGFRFLDSRGNELIGGGEILKSIRTIDDSQVCSELKECRFEVACDVENPLYGKQGAAYIFAPQKGATPDMVEQLDGGLRNFAQVVKQYNGVDIGDMMGAGAAGGAGGGICALLDAKLKRGVDMILNAINFDKIIAGADLVITGEGRIDCQTLMGKAPSGVLSAAQRAGIPTIAICGYIDWCEELRDSGFRAIEVVTPEGMTIVEAMQPDVARENIRHTAEKIAKMYLSDLNSTHL